MPLTDKQEETIRGLRAVVVANYEETFVDAADQLLRVWRVEDDGEYSLKDEAPSLGLPGDFDAIASEGDILDITKELTRPMTPAAVRWKVQTSLGAKSDPWGALVVPYIDARLVEGRLNAVAPGWFEGVPDPENPSRPDPNVKPFEYVDWGRGGAMLCRLTVAGVTHQDVGNGNDAKAMVSDSLKRAAVKFGIGAFLYAIPKVTFKADSGLIRWQDTKDREGKPIRKPWLNETSEAWLPLLYTRWLHEHGVSAFGLPLDHGDAIGAAGEVESLDPEAVAQEGVESDDEEDKEPTEEQAARSLLGESIAKTGKKGK